jgi:glutathione S-transferase
MHALHIWGRISSINVRKVVLTCQWLGLVEGRDFKRTDAGMAFGVVKTPAYLARNPNGVIPTLEHGDFTLWESNVIVRYLAARFCAGSAHPNFYPQDLTARFDAERWMDWQQTTLNRASGPAFHGLIRTAPELRDTNAIVKSIEAMTPLLAQLESHLRRHAFMGGDALGIADVPIACEIHRWWGLPIERAAYPHIEAWYAPLLANPHSTGVLDLPLS